MHGLGRNSFLVGSSAMERSTQALLFLVLLLCCAAMAASANKDLPAEEFGVSLAEKGHKHKHSGFSEAGMASDSSLFLQTAASDATLVISHQPLPSPCSTLVIVSAQVPVNIDAPRLRTRSPACSSARSAAPSAGVFLQEPTRTRRFAHATITGRPREEVPSAHDLLCLKISDFFLSLPMHVFIV
ncbi:hypothetical protein MUK42_03827 [Musa troglodytarum]|uniref:Uncharacterized protein n=1 Tax=Musa troglodytarum TaxID=320322 RepID=A0A9E7G406_9LILI|nr:hypothetical protein MUK42_03827 [Musa troglodytarum]